MGTIGFTGRIAPTVTIKSQKARIASPELGWLEFGQLNFFCSDLKRGDVFE
jgi:hypothetical protein